MTTPTLNALPSLRESQGVTVEWLLQAGFLLKGESESIAIDPYLSDLCYRVHGLSRARTAPYAATDLPASLVLVSHWHEDHFDTDAAAVLAQRGIPFAGPPSCRARFVGLGLPGDLFTALHPGDKATVGSTTVTATPAVHRVPGYLTEDALGFVVSMDDAHVFHTGDSEYHRSIVEHLSDWPLSAALVCVNGTGGNMNVLEAATLVAQIDVDAAVPMHFGLWAGEDIGLAAEWSEQFTRTLRALAPNVTVRQPVAGQPFRVLPPRSRGARTE